MLRAPEKSLQRGEQRGEIDKKRGKLAIMLHISQLFCLYKLEMGKQRENCPKRGYQIRRGAELATGGVEDQHPTIGIKVISLNG